MTSVSYVALRDIASGHSSSNSYYIDFNPRVLDRNHQSKKEILTSLDGTKVSTGYHRNILFNIESDIILYGSSTWNYWMEFIGSVCYGETFDLDYNGTYASPGTIYTVLMEDDPQIIRTQNNNYFTISFNCIYNENF